MPSPVSGAGEKDSLIADLALSTFALWLSRSPVARCLSCSALCAMFLAAKTSCYDDRPDSQTGEEGVSVEDALRYALCALRNFSSVVSISSLNLAPFAPLPLDFPRGPEVLEGRESSFLSSSSCSQ